MYAEWGKLAQLTPLTRDACGLSPAILNKTYVAFGLVWHLTSSTEVWCSLLLRASEWPKNGSNCRIANSSRHAAGSRGMETDELPRALKKFRPTFGIKLKSLYMLVLKWARQNGQLWIAKYMGQDTCPQHPVHKQHRRQIFATFGLSVTKTNFTLVFLVRCPTRHIELFQNRWGKFTDAPCQS